ncbi:hypothetical protein Q6348_11015 [Isoptericola sp. b441]|uniref:Secreted protein n=1 Tax=Actinotalea lenta TaxID=3064654 RepID=A0ABT9DE23_9CELL|nr:MULTISPECIES: hypothetical protein [unclassified Isoptericola]MDO8107726.1 hypothetical protein [Isoptericola sp. b441]MDO8120603.1 hypothetical protein [Isoptericola sp. b490]
MSHARAALVAVASLASLLAAGPAAAATPSGACTDPAGVTVVVDATALGGDVQVGCADQAPATGTDALRQAGFTDTRDAAGMICAVDALPDPCPATFTGQYWSYWYAQDGTWVAYQEGSDTAAPAPGSVEGWRWSDGSAGPQVDLATLAATPSASTSPSVVQATPTGTPAATIGPAGPVQEQSGGFSVPWLPIIAGLIAVGLVVATALSRRSRG